METKSTAKYHYPDKRNSISFQKLKIQIKNSNFNICGNMPIGRTLDKRRGDQCMVFFWIICIHRIMLCREKKLQMWKLNFNVGRENTTPTHAFVSSTRTIVFNHFQFFPQTWQELGHSIWLTPCFLYQWCSLWKSYLYNNKNYIKSILTNFNWHILILSLTSLTFLGETFHYAESCHVNIKLG